MASGKSKKDKAGPPAAEAEGAGLTGDEAELVVRVLKYHLTTLPSYLLSVQQEIALIESILRKLS